MMELTDHALDMRALATAEIERQYVLDVREFLSSDDGEIPDPSLYGLSQEEAQALVLEVLAVEIPRQAVAA